MTKDPHYRALMDYAMRALSRRAHTSHEMRKKLEKRPHFTPKHAEQIIQRLTELNLLNDEAYVRRAIETGTQFRQQGRLKIAQKLFQKGISFDTTERIWNAMNICEREVAEQALQKINPKLAHLPRPKRYSKRARFLISRGFSPPTVFSLVKSE